jgi:hypothetical protein
MSAWRIADERIGLSVEKGTPAVPDDCRYHVVVDGEIVLSTRVEAAAIAEYDDIRNLRYAPRDERLRQLRGDTAFMLMRGASYRDKSARDAKRGGRGIGR